MARFVETIEGLTHREVKAFMSATHQSPDVTVEVFVLEREEIAPACTVMALLWRSWSTRSTIDRRLQLQPLSSPGRLRAPPGGRRG